MVISKSTIINQKSQFCVLAWQKIHTYIGSVIKNNSKPQSVYEILCIIPLVYLYIKLLQSPSCVPCQWLWWDYMGTITDYNLQNSPTHWDDENRVSWSRRLSASTAHVLWRHSDSESCDLQKTEYIENLHNNLMLNAPCCLLSAPCM